MVEPFRESIRTMNDLISRSFLCMTLIMTLVPISRSSNHNLFRASQGGDGMKPPGVWGGSIDTLRSGAADDLGLLGYPIEVPQYNSQYSVTSVAHDTQRNDATILLEHSGHETFTLARGPLCREGAGNLDFILDNVKLVDSENPFLLDNACDWKCGIGPVEVRDGTTYFVFSAVYGQVYALLKREIQIRSLGGCEHLYGTSIPEFNILNCSKLITTLYTQTYQWPNPTLKVWTAYGLKSLPPSGDHAQFVLQMFDTSGSSSQMHVYYVRQGAEPVKLFSQTVDSSYASKTRIRGLGALDYMGNVLCWTAADRLLCSSYTDGQLHNEFTLLAPGEAVEAGVCTGSLPTDTLKRTLTGIAIAEIGNSLTVFFSCYAEIPGVGGVGQVRQTDHGLVKTVYPITSDGRRVFAGSLFIADTVDGEEDCNHDNTEVVTSLPSGASSSVISWSTTATTTTTTVPPLSGDVPDDDDGSDRPHSTHSPIVGTAARFYSSKYALVTVMLPMSTGLLLVQTLCQLLL